MREEPKLVLAGPIDKLRPSEVPRLDCLRRRNRFEGHRDGLEPRSDGLQPTSEEKAKSLSGTIH